MNIIKETRGRAKEYAPLDASLYKGCLHNCLYCYVPMSQRKKREDFHREVSPVTDVNQLLEWLEADAKALEEDKDDRLIQLSFMCDPYPLIEEEHNITRRAIEIFKNHNLHFTILTKAGTRACKDFYLLEGYEKASFGTTLSFTSPDLANYWEPNAASIEDRIAAIQKAHDMKIETWVSIEPVIDSKQALEVIEKLSPIVDRWKIGKINYNKEVEDSIDWLQFREDAQNLLDQKKAKYLLKRSLTAKEKIEIIEGTKSNILIVAPHGFYGDDDNTGEIARLIAKNIGCYAIINEYFQKPENADIEQPSLADKAVNLNRKKEIEFCLGKDQPPGEENQKEQSPAEIEPPKEFAQLKIYYDKVHDFKGKIVKTTGKALIIWLHGIMDDKIDANADVVDVQLAPKAHILMGYGQGDEPKISADSKLVAKLKAALSGCGITALDAKIGSDYCGNDGNNLNQLFVNEMPAVNSIQLEIKYSGFRNRASIEKTAAALGKALLKTESLEIERPGQPVFTDVSLLDIRWKSAEDLKYIFRQAEFKDKDLIAEHAKDIEGLADSIRQEGLLQPLVLVKDKEKEKYRLLCGYRRFQALSSLGREKVPAKVYFHDDLTEQQRLLISITENGERRDLTPVEVADFLWAVKQKTRLGDDELAKLYAEILGIGKTGKTVNKYLQLANIKGKSPKIIEAIQKKKLPFAVAAEVFAPIKNEDERNAFFLAVAPLKLTRTTIQEVKRLLEHIGPDIGKALERKDVKAIFKDAAASAKPKGWFLEQLGVLAGEPEDPQNIAIKKASVDLQTGVFGDNKWKESLTVNADEGKEICLQIRLTQENYAEILQHIGQLANQDATIKGLLEQL